MKRSRSGCDEPSGDENMQNKKVRFEDGKEQEDGECESGFAKLDENLLYEVLKHADARTVEVAACVNKLWNRTAQDERIWELICTRQCANVNCGTQQLRSVVLALGGFRRLHSLYLRPLSKIASSSASGPVTARATAIVPPGRGSKRWGKDEVHLSLSLLSIQYYEKMNFVSRSK